MEINAYADTRNVNLTTQMRSGVESVERTQQVLARIIWSTIAEPGDKVAVEFIRTHGATAALDLVIAGEVPDATTVILDALERWRPRLQSARVESVLRKSVATGVKVLIPGDELWPAGVNDLGDETPYLLYYVGNEDALGKLGRSVAVVGARAITEYGEMLTNEMVDGVLQRDHVVVTGAAFGIDAAVLKRVVAESGTSVSILAGGLDSFFPSGNDDLLRQTLAFGAVLSEVPVASHPNRWRFLKRNRLIAAITRATVVVEAGVRSGSLNIAANAVNLERVVCTVPGNVTSPSSAGCNRLLVEYPGTVKLVTCATDVFEQLL